MRASYNGWRWFDAVMEVFPLLGIVRIFPVDSEEERAKSFGNAADETVLPVHGMWVC